MKKDLLKERPGLSVDFYIFAPISCSAVCGPAKVAIVFYHSASLNKACQILPAMLVFVGKHKPTTSQKIFLDWKVKFLGWKFTLNAGAVLRGCGGWDTPTD